MDKECTHTASIRQVTPSALGCEECLKMGSVWVHLRLCRTCGHVGCCDSSPNRHATKRTTALLFCPDDATCERRDAEKCLTTHSEPDRRGNLRRLLVSPGFPCEKRPEGIIGN